MNRVQINEQYWSIVTEPLYLHSKFEAIKLPKDVVVLNPMEYWTS